jgi:hypothetical protein
MKNLTHTDLCVYQKPVSQKIEQINQYHGDDIKA